MGTKSPLTKDLTDIKKIVEKLHDYTVVQIRKALEGRKGHTFSTEQRVMILKLLQLNEMDYAQTSREANCRRESIYNWERLYGDVVFSAAPSVEIAVKLETDLAVIKSDTLKKTYRTINKGLDKFDELIGKAMSPRQLYAIAEAVKAAVEVIKVEKELGLPAQPKVNDYYMEIHNMMINNIPLKNGNKG
jgi:hypothetical protein